MRARPHIVIVNELENLPFELSDLIEALDTYTMLLEDFWGVTANVSTGRREDIHDEDWAHILLRNSDEADAAGYHDLTKHGYPLAKSFLDGSVDPADFALTISHEHAELLCDPYLNRATQAGDGKTFYSVEVADPVEDDFFMLDGLKMSNFVTPAWFVPTFKRGCQQFDYLEKVKSPFQLLTGGYIDVFQHGRWTQLYGPEPKRAKLRAARPWYRGEIKTSGRPLQLSS